MEKVCECENFRENFSTFKRLANIIKDGIKTGVREELFESEAEVTLYTEFKKIANSNYDEFEKLNVLFGLKVEIDRFFDSVMINVDDDKIRHNRQAIVGEIYAEFLKIADIKEISL